MKIYKVYKKLLSFARYFMWCLELQVTLKSAQDEVYVLISNNLHAGMFSSFLFCVFVFDWFRGFCALYATINVLF